MCAQFRLLALLTTCAVAAAAAGGEPVAGGPTVEFERDVWPLFAGRCLRCHGAVKPKSGYRLDQRDAALRGGDSGEPAIVPRRADESRLVRLIAGLDPDTVMPPKGPRLKESEIALIRAWIDQGAHWPAGAGTSASAEGRQHWSLLPLVLPKIPRPKDAGWVRTPIDAFIRAGLEAKGLAPAPEADRRTLIRRLSFDLTGLPPTPGEVDAFLDDAAPGAYERLIDRLLQSPRYGERWARHWMDVVHFAETHGNDQDRPRPNAWPYRDYLIRSFNDDLPYARFVGEQIAGDVLSPGDPRGIVALGFLAAGPWDESSQRDIRDDTVDKRVAQNLDRDDMLTTVMSTFLSTTVHCARCHDHKFDPITQAEYYGLQAVFAGVDRAERPYDVDPRAESLRAPLLAKKTALETRRPEVVDPLLSAGTRARLAAAQADWESAARAQASAWIALDPTTFTSKEGATPARQPDLSIRYGGKRPDVDTYTIVARTELKAITSVRLELLTDDELPHKGPGRQDNGNLHLSEFRLTAAPASSPAAARPVTLKQAVADFDQAGWTAAMAIDGNPATAWGIYPQVGQPHQAVFTVAEPIGSGEGMTELTFTLEQSHGRGHLIGRLRISVSNAPNPPPSPPLPEPIAAILRVPSASRNAAQRSELTAAFYVTAPEIHAAIDEVAGKLAAIPEPPRVYAAAHDFKSEGSFSPARKPRAVHVLRRGEIHNPIGPAVPGALACVPGLAGRFELANPDDEASRRAALAGWITDPKNVLAWRSIVNRIWHYHFGRGLADSPNDLGRMGAPPTHPELIDWLAVTFRDGGGSLKKLHRLILTSATYRQSCRHDPACALVDADNLYLWRMNRARLDAESVRDALLQVSGKLDLTMGGPSVQQFVQKPGIHVTPDVDYQRFDVDSPASYRRSVYRFLFRTLPDPFMDSMDCPDASQLSPKRNASVTPLQALAMLNDRFVVRQCEHLAARVVALAPDLPGQVDALYRLALGRPPAPDERDAVAAYAARHGMANACRMIVNSNEFMFIN